MQELYKKLKKYNLEDAIKIEESDRQYIALKKLYKKIRDKKYYLSLILANSIICYQLSGKGEDYWEEFSEYFIENKFENNLVKELGNFIKQSKNNKRFIDTKINRLKKISQFVGADLCVCPKNKCVCPKNKCVCPKNKCVCPKNKCVCPKNKWEYYYNNMEELRDELAKSMKQKIDAKTIVFAIKMFNYGARNYFNKLNYFPKNINIPVDSRLIKLFEKYKGNYSEIDEFYKDLSKKIGIPELHLDAIIWVNYEKFIN